jgi:hypothetical protein
MDEYMSVQEEIFTRNLAKVFLADVLRTDPTFARHIQGHGFGETGNYHPRIGSRMHE